MTYGIPFVHKTNARSRSVKIHVEANGTVVVTTPPRFAKFRLHEYVEEARAWIEEQQLKLRDKPILWSASSVFYFGIPHEIVHTDRMDGSVHVRENTIYVSPLKDSASAVHELLESWLKNRAIEYCLTRVEILGKHMNVTYHNVHFKQQKTRWGSCSSDKNLNFNWRLIHAPKEVVDYVIIHELAHTVHMNHGRQFWDLVAKFDPDHPQHRGWLKRYGNTED